MKKILIWLAATVVTLSAAYYQRLTGPTYPKRDTIVVNDSAYKIRMVRSLGLDERPAIRLAVYDSTVSAKLFYKRFKTGDPFSETEFRYRVIPLNSFIMNRVFGIHEIKGFFASVPQQPPAGKLEYYFEITDKTGTRTFYRENPVVIRFKGAVPGWFLTPHIILMFLAMLLSTVAGIMAITRQKSFRIHSIWALALLTAGGMVMGPVIQYYAFGAFWTGVPFGWDLTDNKTLVAFLFWVLAVVMNRKKERPFYAILASVILLVVYSIPHSMFGSELDYDTGKVIQGYLSLFR